jgi:hypothetical protein
MQIAAALVIAVVTLCGAGVACAETYAKIVQQNCRDDYKRLCSEYGLESAALRSCMDRNGKSLSKACVKALVAAGEVTQAEVDRRKKVGN